MGLLGYAQQPHLCLCVFVPLCFRALVPSNKSWIFLFSCFFLRNNITFAALEKPGAI
jgi:hypothetical protein